MPRVQRLRENQEKSKTTTGHQCNSMKIKESLWNIIEIYEDPTWWLSSGEVIDLDGLLDKHNEESEHSANADYFYLGGILSLFPTFAGFFSMAQGKKRKKE